MSVRHACLLHSGQPAPLDAPSRSSNLGSTESRFSFGVSNQRITTPHISSSKLPRNCALPVWRELTTRSLIQSVSRFSSGVIDSRRATAISPNTRKSVGYAIPLRQRRSSWLSSPTDAKIAAKATRIRSWCCSSDRFSSALIRASSDRSACLLADREVTTEKIRTPREISAEILGIHTELSQRKSEGTRIISAISAIAQVIRAPSGQMIVSDTGQSYKQERELHGVV